MSSHWEIEDICCIGVNSVYSIFSWSVTKTSVISQVRSMRLSENLDFFIIQDENIYCINGKKTNFLYILLFSCFSASDVLTDVAKQNRSILTSTLNAYHKEREKQVFLQIKVILIPETWRHPIIIWIVMTSTSRVSCLVYSKAYPTPALIWNWFCCWQESTGISRHHVPGYLRKSCPNA